MARSFTLVGLMRGVDRAGHQGHGCAAVRDCRPRHHAAAASACTQVADRHEVRRRPINFQELDQACSIVFVEAEAAAPHADIAGIGQSVMCTSCSGSNTRTVSRS